MIRKIKPFLIYGPNFELKSKLNFESKEAFNKYLIHEIYGFRVFNDSTG